MDLKLKVMDGKHAGQEVPVTVNKFFIGRAEDCQLRPASDLISRHHCAILVEEGYIAIRDFGSKNGTYVNDERVCGECELKAGDQLRVGPLNFVVDIAHGLAAKKRPPVASVQEVAARTAETASASSIDVTQWLASEAKPKTTADTQRLEFSDTSITQTGAREIVPEPVADASASGVGDTAAPAGEAPHDAAKSKTPGKLPPIPRDVSKDSRDAAAKVLAQLRKRR